MRKLLIFVISISLIGCGSVDLTNQNIQSGVIVAFGDSLTIGQGVSDDENYPVQLKGLLSQQDYNYDIVNMGVSRNTTKQGLDRVGEVLGSNPEIVILALGANDSFQRVPIQQTRKNLESIIQQIKAKNINILLVGIKPAPTRGLGYSGDFSDMYEELSEKYNLVYMPRMLKGVRLKSRYNTSDGIHPNKQGYEIIVNRMWEHLKPMLRT